MTRFRGILQGGHEAGTRHELELEPGFLRVFYESSNLKSLIVMTFKDCGLILMIPEVLQLRHETSTSWILNRDFFESAKLKFAHGA